MTIHLKEARLESGMTQEELAKKAGVSRPMISFIETGKITNISTGTLVKIAEALGKSINDLFF